ncbi:MAG: Inner membrane protein YbaL [bacterium ADurb.Bin363]|nr:MAG: Inner membrane protein YbaL [bacterium ADurb.Bin363]
MGNSIFGELVVILILSTLSLCICFRLRIPGIIGFFLAGTLAGPHLFGLVKSIHEVEMLAEIGVILLLFTIGIEFSVKQILQLKKAVLIGGGLQVFLTIVFIFFLTHLAGYSFGGAVFIGFLKPFKIGAKQAKSFPLIYDFGIDKLNLKLFWNESILLS